MYKASDYLGVMLGMYIFAIPLIIGTKMIMPEVDQYFYSFSNHPLRYFGLYSFLVVFFIWRAGDRKAPLISITLAFVFMYFMIGALYSIGALFHG